MSSPGRLAQPGLFYDLLEHEPPQSNRCNDVLGEFAISPQSAADLACDLNPPRQ
jgi:hypothetical protein